MNKNYTIKSFIQILFRLSFMGMLGFQVSAWGACSGDASVSTALVSSQANNTWLCSYSVTNSGSISVSASVAVALDNNGNINTFANNGLILSSGSGSSYGVNNGAGFFISNFINTGTISSGNVAVRNSNISTTTLLDNSGTISGVNKGIGNSSGTLTTLINSGTISSSAGSAVYIFTGSGGTASVGTITNTGSLVGAIASINNVNATLGTLNNNQGAGNVNGALTYTGILPTNYNIIINSSTQYGQILGSSISGSTNFGIYSGSVVAKGTYTNVFSGFNPSNLSSTSGNFNGFSWKLSEVDLVNGLWNLIVGPSTADTQASLVNTASVLQSTYILQNSVLANSFSYDCTVFGANDVCVSAGGRNTQVSAANGLNNTSALLIAGYRLNNNYRIGAYADQNLSVNNAGSTVNLGNNTPLIGLFGAWNERQDGTGTEVKVSAAYGQKNTTITRQVVGTSEPGSGSSQLNSQGAQATVKYGFGLADTVIVSPYVGIRYTQNNMGGYTEGTSSTVTAPLTYSALNTNATTALAGVGASYKVIPKVTTFASAGVETDTNTANGTYSATGVTGLTPINFNANPVKTRPTATVGAYYDIEKNQRLGITGIYRQEAYQAVQTTTVMATYTVGL